MITNTQTQFAFAMSDEGPIEKSILHAARRLGNHDLREQQLHAAKKFLQGNDVFVSLPTGSGKFLFVLFYRLRLTIYAAAKAPLLSLITVTTRKKIHCILGMKDPSCHHCHVTRQGQYVLLGERKRNCRGNVCLTCC